MGYRLHKICPELTPKTADRPNPRRQLWAELDLDDSISERPAVVFARSHARGGHVA